MDLQIHLYKPQAIDSELQVKLLSIAERAFPSTNPQRPQILSHFVGPLSYCIVASISSRPVAFLFFQFRTALSLRTKLSFLSVGPVATDPNFQKRGIGSQLIGFLNSYAVDSNVDLIILSGIPDYYTKYGFYPFMIKSKITASRHNLLQAAATTFPEVYTDSFFLGKNYLPPLTYGTEQFSITRSSDDWDWLLSTHAQSYYFPSPVFLANELILKQSPQYYSVQHLEDKVLIREFHAYNKNIEYLLAYLVSTNSSSEAFEFYTSYNSPLFRFLVSRIPFEFSSYPHPTARALMKIINPTILPKCMKRRSEPLHAILNSPQLTSELSSLLLEETGKSIEYYLPGLLSGLWSSTNIMLSNNQVKFSSAFPLLSNTHPFVYQGDSL